MSQRIPPKIFSESIRQGRTVEVQAGDANSTQAQGSHSQGEKVQNSAPSAAANQAKPAAELLPQSSAVQSETSGQFVLADHDLGRTPPGVLVNFAKAKAPAELDDSKDSSAVGNSQLGHNGPEPSLNERRILEDMLDRLGGSLDDQMRNLVSGFLHSLPQNPTRSEINPPRGQLGALAQVVSLRDKTPKVLPKKLDVDSEADPVSRQDLQDLCDATGAKAQLLVALGAADETELAQLDAGTLTLGDFYRLAARGHFGAQADQPVRYEVLRHKLTGAGLDLDFHHLLKQLDERESQQIIDGQLTPLQAFSALARGRGRDGVDD